MPVILPRVVAMYAITGLAFIFYIFKMPERFVPCWCAGCPREMERN